MANTGRRNWSDMQEYLQRFQITPTVEVYCHLWMELSDFTGLVRQMKAEMPLIPFTTTNFGQVRVLGQIDGIQKLEGLRSWQ